MRIERLQVEEGFLDGLDLEFANGLNVLIGARGTGKTSVIELLRFALDAPTWATRTRERARAQVEGVLGPGQVTVTLEVDGQRIQVMRTTGDQKPRATAEYPKPTVLAQNEIETIGVEPQGRLALIDRHLELPTTAAAGLYARLRSQTTELEDLVSEIEALTAQAGQMGAAPAELEKATADLAIVQDRAATDGQTRKQLDELQAEAAAGAAREQVLARGLASLERYRARLADVVADLPRLEQWPATEGAEDRLVRARQRLSGVSASLAAASSQVEQTLAELSTLRSDSEREQVEIASRIRPLRVALEESSRGASAAANRVQTLREEVARLLALRGVINERTQRFESGLAQRRITYGELEQMRGSVLASRQAVATALNRSLGGTVKVEVFGGADDDRYVQSIVGSLTGSGLHYNRLAPEVAKRVTPLELSDAALRGDATWFAATTGWPLDRCVVVLGALRHGGTSEIVASPIRDSAILSLLDGRDFKTTEELSIGQRCTVVLPILLSKHGDVLVIDQPEDHLDNAFVTSTLVTALRQRTPDDQLILATHNANIPVLGEADRVVLMESDGRRAFAMASGPLDHAEVVEAITRVMEGGREAFEKRAAFYASHR